MSENLTLVLEISRLVRVVNGQVGVMTRVKKIANSESFVEIARFKSFGQMIRVIY